MEHEHYGEEAQRHASKTLEETRAQAADIVRKATESGSSYIDSQRRLAAVEVDGYACALHEAASQLHDQSQDLAADYTERLADKLDLFAHNLREREIRDSFERLSDYARREPMMFLGGAVAAGFIVARFMKSSTNGEHPEMSERAGEFKEKIERGVEHAKEATHEKVEQAREKITESGHREEKHKTAKESHTAADVEIPVILKPHDPEHPGGPGSTP